MRVHLIDGTYELFRHFFALPSEQTNEGQEIAATVGVVGSVLGMLESGVTHVAVATDHVIESFRNDLWPGYKDGSGIDPTLFSQFGYGGGRARSPWGLCLANGRIRGR